MSINEIQDRIVGEMTRLDDWMDRYTYLIQTGKSMQNGDQDLRREENLIQGCQSQVWVTAELADGVLHFKADSDAAITRGIIALVLQVIDGQKPADIAEADLYVFRQTGLESNLSPARANGLASIIHHVRTLARSYC